MLHTWKQILSCHSAGVDCEPGEVPCSQRSCPFWRRCSAQSPKPHCLLCMCTHSKSKAEQLTCSTQHKMALQWFRTAGSLYRITTAEVCNRDRPRLRFKSEGRQREPVGSHVRKPLRNATCCEAECTREVSKKSSWGLELKHIPDHRQQLPGQPEFCQMMRLGPGTLPSLLAGTTGVFKVPPERAITALPYSPEFA